MLFGTTPDDRKGACIVSDAWRDDDEMGTEDEDNPEPAGSPAP